MSNYHFYFQLLFFYFITAAVHPQLRSFIYTVSNLSYLLSCLFICSSSVHLPVHAPSLATPAHLLSLTISHRLLHMQI